MGWNGTIPCIERPPLTVVDSIDTNDGQARVVGVGTTQPNETWRILAVCTPVPEK